MATPAELQANLADAEAALHQLLTGAKVASVGYEGKTVSYTQASVAGLRAYIAELNTKLGLTVRRPLRPYF